MAGPAADRASPDLLVIGAHSEVAWEVACDDVLRAVVLSAAILWPYGWGLAYWPAVSLGVMLLLDLLVEWRATRFIPPRQDEAEDDPGLGQWLGKAPALQELARSRGPASGVLARFADGLGPWQPHALYVRVAGRPVFAFAQETVNRLPVEELRCLLAHELGHYRLGHLWKSAAARVAADLAAVGVACLAAMRLAAAHQSLGRYAGAAPLVLLAYALARAMAQPVLNAYWRRQELTADREALEICPQPGAMIAAIRRLADDGAGMKPPGWLERLLTPVPTTRQKIALAERFAATHNIPPGERGQPPQAQRGK